MGNVAMLSDKNIKILRDELEYIRTVSIPNLKTIKLHAQENRKKIQQLIKNQDIHPNK
jgi:hypothetical protein